MVEDIILKLMIEDGKEEKEVEIQVEGVCKGENVCFLGSDIKVGFMIFSCGEQIFGVGGEIGFFVVVGVLEV